MSRYMKKRKLKPRSAAHSEAISLALRKFHRRKKRMAKATAKVKAKFDRVKKATWPKKRSRRYV
jgi:hypothetical protein